jgi:hypothetical protein
MGEERAGSFLYKSCLKTDGLPLSFGLLCSTLEVLAMSAKKFFLACSVVCLVTNFTIALPDLTVTYRKQSTLLFLNSSMQVKVMRNMKLFIYCS